MLNRIVVCSPVLFTLLIISCQSDIAEEEVDSNFVNVDAALIPYFETFEKEAALRGYNFDLGSLKVSGEITEISENGVAGTCQYGGHIHPHVTVDVEFWNRSNSLGREFVVFHELGHCVLKRDHEESSFENGICTSLMRSGLGNCLDAYNARNRTYYIDELFSEVNR